jgi:selenocysteine lyase/cysteine desulfurase
MNKRDFIRTLSGATAGLILGPELLDRLAALPPQQLAQDDAFWATLRSRFKLTSDYINLENGFYCFQPEPVLEAFIKHVRALNLEASHYLRTRRDPDKLRVRTRLAGMAGCSPDELIVTRNTTESLDTVIAGFDWKAGDEAVMANQDYKAMLYMFDQQAKRYGVVNRRVDIPLDPKSDDEVVQLYARALTPRTRLLLIPHMVNVTGHILPVRAICDMAHERGVPVLVDGAHTFAHFDFRIPDLHCDYFGASLHKWLAAPLGAGILYVKQDRIEKLWPIYGDETIPVNDIRKLNHTGTHPAHTDLTILNAIEFHELIGIARKEARLRYLQQYWVRQVRGQPRIVLNTPTDPRRSCAIANVGIVGIPPLDLAKLLLEKHKVFTVGYDNAGVHGLRVTPQVYTSLAELDTFVRALKALSVSA